MDEQTFELDEPDRAFASRGGQQALDQVVKRARDDGIDIRRRELFDSGGAHSDGNTAMNKLPSFQSATARARNGGRDLPRDHPDSDVPGRSVAPTRGAMS